MTSAQRKEAEANGSSQGAQVCIVFLLLDMYFVCIFPGPERLLRPQQPLLRVCPTPSLQRSPSLLR